MAEEIKIVASAVGFEKVEQSLNNTSKALNETAKQAEKTDKALGSLKPGAAQAATTLTNLNRVVSDSPYGFIGIANNINPLVESFARLRAESGSVGGALKSLVGGLSGAGGLGLAFGVITSAITFAQIGFSSWSRGSKDAKDSSDNFKSTLEQLKISLGDVTVSLNNFVSVANNALKLNDINIKARFSDEGTQKLLSANANYITISEEVVAATEARIKAEKNWQNISESSFKTTDEYTQAQKAAFEVFQKAGDKEIELINLRTQVAAQNKLNAIEEQRANAKRLADLDTIAKTLAKLKEDTKDSRNLAIALNISTLQAQADLIKAAITKLINKFNVDPKSSLILGLRVDLQRINNQINSEEFQKSLKPLKFQAAIEPKPLKESSSIASVRLYFEKIAKQAEELAKAKLADYSNIVTNLAKDSAAQFGMIFGTALAGAISGQTNGIKDAFIGLFTLFGDAVIQLGKYAIEYSGAIIALKKAIAAGAGLTGIGLGIGLIALGILIKTAMSGIGKTGSFATGSRYTPGVMALVGERGPEMVYLPRGSSVTPAAQTSQMMGGMAQAIEVYGMVRGQDIFFSNRKYGKTYNRTT
jgi:hypothetical protein